MLDRITVVLGLLAASTLAGPVKHDKLQENQTEIYRLPNNVVPTHYHLGMKSWGFITDRYDQPYKHKVPILNAGKFLSPRENQMLLQHEVRDTTDVDCCPSVLEMIEPEGGKNLDGQYVELYKDGNTRQRFYEQSCHKDVLNKPCRFVDKNLRNQSRCVQKYSYTYALIKDSEGHHHPSFPATGPGGIMLTLDYIRVRSGCSCVVTQTKNENETD